MCFILFALTFSVVFIDFRKLFCLLKNHDGPIPDDVKAGLPLLTEEDTVLVKPVARLGNAGGDEEWDGDHEDIIAAQVRQDKDVEENGGRRE